MRQIESRISIAAKPERVWQVLTDFDNHPKWNPFIRSIEGKQQVGEKLKVLIQPPGGKAMTFRPEVLKFSVNKEFRWKGKLLVKGIFDGEHYFRLEKKDADQTTFIHGEKFSGILVPLMDSALSDTKKGFELMNESIRKECEKP